MAFSLYDATIVQAKLALATLNHILTEGEKHPNASAFPDSRLCEDMYPLTNQVHLATRFAELVAARLSNKEVVEPENNIKTWQDMHARIDKAVEALAATDKDTVNRVGEEVAPTNLPSAGTMELTGKAFAMGAAVPNITFHVDMAYAILRKEGVSLGKRDYITAFVGEYIMKM